MYRFISYICIDKRKKNMNNNTWFWFIQFNLKKQMWVNNCYGRLFDPTKRL